MLIVQELLKQIVNTNDKSLKKDMWMGNNKQVNK